MSLVLLNPAGGVQGVLQTRAPRACAHCIMLVSTVVGVALANAELA